MKEQFFEFDYSLDESELKQIWQSSETIFVIDTNVFLNLYSYQETTRNTIFDIMEKLKERLWSPHQIMLEYNKNRNEIIYKSRKNFESIANHLTNYINSHNCTSNELKTFDTDYGKIYPELRDLFSNFEKESSQYSRDFIEQLTEKSKVVSNKIEELRQQTINLKGKDTIRERLASFYSDDKIGHPYTKEQIDKIYEEGQTRYDLLIPPGYKDADKTEIYFHRGIFYQSKFGDLLLYKQILQHCKDSNVTNVIFITEDNKEDWKEKIPHEKQSYYGIRREIRAEAFEEALIKNFITFNVKEFIESSNQDKLEESLVDDLDSVHQLYLNYSNINSYKNRTEDVLLGDYNNKKNEILKQIKSYEDNLVQVHSEINSIDETIDSIHSSYYTNPDIDSELHIEFSAKLEDLWRRKRLLKNYQEELKSKQRQMEENLENLFSLKNYINNANLLKNTFNVRELNSRSIETENNSLDIAKYFDSNEKNVYINSLIDEKEKVLNPFLKAYEANQEKVSNSSLSNKNFLDIMKSIRSKNDE